MASCFVGGAVKKKFACGTFTPASDITSPYTIGGLGFNPTAGMLIQQPSSTSQADVYAGNYIQFIDSLKSIGIWGGNYGTSYGPTMINATAYPYGPSFGVDSITFYAAVSYAYQIKAGYTYIWFAWADD